ncbi:hypothetical protein DMNBHIDG_00769 [Candidatus Methanoperedenaceae archaeon GB37]|nr:hypothetical protein DMNBHIDG_00769 [Candidatus Methanoperedenaceae archaeon GB37]
MKKLLVFSFVAIFLMMAAGAQGTNGGTGKWLQPPDMEYGVNIKSTESEPIVADDWKCEDPREIVDVHFWGSYIGWEIYNPEPPLPPPGVNAFIIRIYKDVPAGADPDFPYSHPGELLYEKRVTEFKERYYGTITHPDKSYEHKFYYSLDLPEPFYQREGTVYWISIAAVMPDGSEFPWGWETSTAHWNDNACWFREGFWKELKPGEPPIPEWYPHRTVDMAFELTVEFEPPPPLEPIKWQQRPDMEQGVNIISIPIMPSQNPVERGTVADDWLCLDASPVSDLHFWGSYPGWEEQNPGPLMTPPPGVEAFRIQVYSNAPATSPQDFSRPDKLLYEVWVKDFTETYVASIFHFWDEKWEHKYRYDLDLPRIFWQKRDKIYWLNISAIPKNPDYLWGWESSMDRWGDFAVKGWYLDPDNWWWEMIKHPYTGENIDMAFELTTCEGPIKWLQFPDMANGINILSLDPVVADDWLCIKGKPITEIHFWGSYLSCDGQVHWEQRNPGPPENPLPPTPGLSGFWISFHKNVPAGVDPDMPWSHPGELIKEIWVDFKDVKEIYWDSVSHSTGPDGLIWWEHKFYYIVRLEEPFKQEEGTIYWLNIGATPLPDSRWCWGWETSKDHWNDNAVQGSEEWWEDLGASTIDFEDLILGTTYNCCGYKFTTSGIPVTLKKFQWSNGQWTSDGYTKVQDGGQAGGSGNEMWVNNVNLDFGFGVPLTHLSLLFGEYGGNVNIEINGDFRNVLNFSDINGLTIGGVLVTVVDFGGGKGGITLTGVINQFAIGGQELAIDNVEAPIDMAFALITKDDTKYCEGDFDRDGDVDGSDLAIFAADFGRTDCYFTGDCEGDFDYDGDVDGSDLAVFAADFGRTDCPCALNVP